MKTKIILSIMILSLSFTVLYAQKTDRKAERLARKVEQEQKVKMLVDSKSFEFKAQRAHPQGFRSINLTSSSNSVIFSPSEIDSYLPFFGRAYSADYNRDGGIKFKSSPEFYTVENVKNGYLVQAKVKGENDTYTLSMTISPAGSAMLTVMSNNRSSISYNGEIGAIAK